MMRNYNKYRKYNNKRKSFNPYMILFIFVIVIMLMSVGYAAYTDILTIIGSANAQYTTCTINYVLDGGSNPANTVTSFRLLVDDSPLPIPTKTNYDFDGWYLDSSFSGSAIISTIEISPEDITNNQVALYAKWVRSYNCNITYVLNGGTQAANQITSFTTGQELTILNPTRSGYVFDGWYDNSSFTGSAITTTAGLTNDITLHAKWLEEYTITYVLNGGTQAANQVTTFTSGQSLTILNATGNDCTFDGWYENSNFTGSAITSTSALSGNTTLYAKYTKSVDFLIDTTASSVTLTTDRISSSNTADYNTFLGMSFTGFNSTNRVINKIDVSITYQSQGQQKTTTCRLTSSGGTDKTTTLTYGKNQNTTTTVSFTGLSIASNETFTITNEELNSGNSNLTISKKTITVYFSN